MYAVLVEGAAVGERFAGAAPFAPETARIAESTASRARVAGSMREL
jgi:hypothetical protein